MLARKVRGFPSFIAPSVENDFPTKHLSLDGFGTAITNLPEQLVFARDIASTNEEAQMAALGNSFLVPKLSTE